MSASGRNLIAYADCFSGVSGDMFLGALLDAGLELEQLQTELKKLVPGKFSLRSTRQEDQGIGSTRLKVEAGRQAACRNWRDIRLLIKQSRLPETTKDKGLRVFACLAEAEARIHNCHVEAVHFHEIGGMDTIIDIMGSVIGLHSLGVADLVTSPLPMPRGWVRCEHGLLPLPAPAVCEILRDTPVYGVAVEHELVTPTGAALVKSLSRNFGDMPPMTVKQTGYGAGRRQLSGGRPNLFRLVIGEECRVAESQEVDIIETNLDDWSPEGYPHLCEQLFASGALDVSLIPLHMKKGRPGFLLQVISHPAASMQIKQNIFAETSAIGLRFRREKRMTLPRTSGTVQTAWGPVRVKRVSAPGGPVLYPEYEECRRVALAKRIPLKAVYAAVNRCSPDDFTEENE